jgi:hypothetical protein
MGLQRLAWILTIAAALITSVFLLVSGYQGYAGVFLAVGIAAAVNLR